MKYPLMFAVLNGLFWGLYGTVLAQARTQLGSPFKPYFAIGLAYIVWAIIGGLIGMKLNGDTFTFGGAGMGWGFAAGTLGAFGALMLTLAMFTGGASMPHVVMPIVFGGAVTVSALVSWYSSQHTGSPWLWVGIAIMAVGTIMVAYNTPHATPPGPGSPAAASEEQ